MDIKNFLNEFNKNYDFLYENNDNVAGYREALEAFETFSNKYKKFISDFVKYRGDFLSSDRECVAFMFTLEEFL